MSGHPTETEFLLAAAQPVVAAPDKVRQLVSDAGDKFDWGYVVDQAYRHHVLALLGRNVTRLRLYPPPETPSQVFAYQEMFLNAYHANQVRNEGLLREVAALTDEFTTRGICFLLRKGLVLAQEVYHDLGARRSYDIDVMIEPDHLPRLKEAMTVLGYAQGNPSANRRVVEPMSRPQSVYWTMRVPNLSFRRQSSERFVNAFVVDVCLNQFLPDSGYDLPVGKLTQRSREAQVFGLPVQVFDPEEMVVDLATHLFKEATTFHYVRIGKDLTIAKFLDIAGYVGQQAIDWERLARLCDSYGVGPPVYYALHYVDELYPGVVPGQVLDTLRPEDTGYLREVGATDKDVQEWREDFRTRLFDPTRSGSVPRTRAPI